MWWDVVVSKVLAVPQLWLLGGGSAVLTVGLVAGNEPLIVAGMGGAVASYAATLRRSTPDERAKPPRRTPPSVGSDVFDGTRPPLRAAQVLFIPLEATALLAAGVAALAWVHEIVGFLLGALGLYVLGLGLGLGLVSSVRRYGLTWAEAPDHAWPDGFQAGEIIEVWEEDTLGFPRTHGFWLRVQASDRTWEVRTRQAVPERWVRALRPGLKVTVRAHPGDSHRVPIDWSASSPPA